MIITLGTRGDVQPYVALGEALAARGHAVSLATGQGFDALIRGAGLEPVALSIDYRQLLDTPEVKAAMRTFAGKLRAARMMKDENARLRDELWAACQRERPDLLIVSPKGFLAVVIARVLGIPCVTSTLQPGLVERGDFPPFLLARDLGPRGNRLAHRAVERLTLAGQNQFVKAWARRNLPPGSDIRLRGFHGHHPDGRPLPLLQAYSAHLVPPPPEWGALEPVTGYWFRATPSEPEPLAPALAAFLDAGPAPIYVGFGSMPPEDARQLTELVVAAVVELGQRAVLASGWGALEANAATPPEVLVIRAAPHPRLFPRCAAIVHHGGSGTTHESLRAGRPAVICPAGVDQPFWARRLVSRGLMQRVVPLAELTRDTLVAQLRVALGEPVRAASAELGDALRRESGAEAAAEILLAAIA
nr:glycosyltransferase [Pseudenhygromyxa sp. WMMC2535]